MKAFIFVFCIVLLGSAVAQQKQPWLNDTDEEDNPCLEQLRTILSPEGAGDLLSMALNTGKGINQLGDFEACHSEGLDYILFSVIMEDTNFSIAKLGICSPRECNSAEKYGDISNLILEKARSIMPPDTKLKTSVEVSREILAEPMSSGAIVVIALICSIMLLWILGMIVTYTNFGNKSNPISQRIEDRKQKWALALHSFNPYENVSKLFTVKEGGDRTLQVLNGVRVLSICWVILGHSFSFIFFYPVVNSMTAGEMFNNELFSIIAAGVFAVDTFFFLSCFLTFALLLANLYPKRGRVGIGNYCLIYFHRYYILIFPLVFVQLFTMFLARYIGSGPYYRQTWDKLNVACFKNPWQNFLFIANFYPWQLIDTCIIWVWFLMNDMQFFILSPPIIFLYCMNKKIGKLIPLVLVIISMIVNGVFTAIWDVSIFWVSEDGPDMQSLMYNKPWSRMGAYFVGALFGISYFEAFNAQKYSELSHTVFSRIYTFLRNSRKASLVSFVIGLALTAIFVFPQASYFRSCGIGGLYGNLNCWPLLPSVLFNVFSRPLFVTGVGLILVPTFVGRLRVIKGFLSADIFQVLARLNYVVYLIHCVFLFHFFNDMRSGMYITILTQFFTGIGATAFSFLFAIPVTMLCEVPFMNLEKYILFPKKNGSTKPEELEGDKPERLEKFYKLSDPEEAEEKAKSMLFDNTANSSTQIN
ncbi:unnamed protein product [Moneuplotes crassus]|uniref:Acyltransferase 3 domain-containing protein n=1 Tax=Euplotes crassus TaxID=5936 RepID=A0AAD2DCD1_EUPCR|nr:unnamed protein product [Moneuplotes crassus]